MNDETKLAYDALAANYHLMYRDWKKSSVEQGQVLDAIIRKHLPSTASKAILDCSCGIGTQAIGLALRGYKVHVTDLSPRSIVQARAKAKQEKVAMAFGVWTSGSWQQGLKAPLTWSSPVTMACPIC